MVYPWAVMIGLGVGIAGLLFMLFQEDRENRRRNGHAYGQRLIEGPNGPSDAWAFPDDGPGPSQCSARGPRRPVHGTNCAICQESISAQDTPEVLVCTHCFHAPCISKWIRENRSCPICRVAV